VCTILLYGQLEFQSLIEYVEHKLLVKAFMGLERRKGHKKFMNMSKRKWTIGKFKLLLVWRKSLGDGIPCFIFSTLSHFCEQLYLNFHGHTTKQRHQL
jgi:hypothetical protein